MHIRGLSEDHLPLAPEEFADRLVSEIDAYIDEHELDAPRFTTERTEEQMREVLIPRIYDEIVTLDLTRSMLPDVERTGDQQLFTRLLKQVEDEARHARMLSQRLWRIGGAPQRVFETVSDSSKERCQQFEGLDVIEMAVVLHCCCERLARRRATAELEYFDEQTAEIYRNGIVPEEEFHINTGVTIITEHCTDEKTQRKAVSSFRENRDAIRTHYLQSC